MFGDDAIANAQTETGPLADRFRRVKGIKNSGRVFNAGPAVGELDEQAVAVNPGAHPQITIAGAFQDGVDGVVHQIEKYLLKLVGIGGGEGQIVGQVQVNADVAHTQVVIPERQGLFESLVDVHGNTFRLVLAGEAQEILVDAVRALGLLVEFIGILDPLRSHLPAGGQQLAVAKDGGQRVV